jgi:hypothetical protein
MKNKQQEGLKREIGILDVAINVVNISIASGIFLLPALSIWVIFIFCQANIYDSMSFVGKSIFHQQFRI